MNKTNTCGGEICRIHSLFERRSIERGNVPQTSLRCEPELYHSRCALSFSSAILSFPSGSYHFRYHIKNYDTYEFKTCAWRIKP